MFYRIDEHPLTGWGDYGTILQHGMTAHVGRVRGRLSLERTGPFMPPITFPGVGDVVLTSDAKAQLEKSGLSGFSFQLVHKARIVRLPWNEWDLTAGEPPEYPESGEPEDYILERRKDSRLAEAMGDIWELVVPVTARIGRAPKAQDFSFERMMSSQDRFVEVDSWNGADVFRGEGLASVLVTERAKEWLEGSFRGYVEFAEFNSQ